MDGIDALVADLSAPQPQVLGTHCQAIPDTLARAMRDMARGAPFRAHAVGDVDNAFANLCVQAVQTLLDTAGVSKGQVCAIGSHGQTLWHAPDPPSPYTWQIGNPAIIAQQTGITTVADFRRADMAAGGQGAPLAPILHQACLADDTERRGILNLGGIANLTVLDGRTLRAGFDTGPASTLMDAWIHRHLQQPFDDNGRWAAEGTVQRDLLDRLMATPYLKAAAPKSTGPELFNLSWLADFDIEALSAVDVQATLLQFTAQSIVDAAKGYRLDRLLVCGGGVHNTQLMNALKRLLTPMRVESTAAYGVDPDHVESLLMAWLAQARLSRRRVDLRAVTGSTAPVWLGAVYRAG